MKVLWLIMAFILATALSACGAASDREPGDTTTPSQFLTLVELDQHESATSSKTWSWADEESLATVEVGDELRFVFGYLRGTYRVELKEWNTAGVSVDDLPFALDYDEGNAQDVRTFDWTPEEEGEYHFSLWLSNQSGQPRADTPIELVVVVGDEETVDPDPDPDLSELIRWFNVTVDAGRDQVEDEDVIEPVGGDGGISVNWSVAPVDGVEITVTSDGDQVYRSTEEENSRWISFDVIEDSDVVVRLRIEDDGRSYAKSIRFEVAD
jgi:hypothetical protein